jgi:hypothetical protein
MGEERAMTANRVVQGCLIGVAGALLVVGVVSGTLLRHVVQILPMIIALIVVQRRPGFGAYAALPIFILWVLIPVLIWLFLLGLSKIANGHYTIIEIVMTVVMAACSIVGVVKSIPLGRSASIGGRAAAFVLFAALQVGAMFISFLPSIANR